MLPSGPAMPKFTIEHSHALGPSEVRQRLDGLCARLAEKYGLEAKWKSDHEAVIKGTGASGNIVCRAGAVALTVDLSFVLTPMRERIESRIRRELTACLAETPPDQA